MPSFPKHPPRKGDLPKAEIVALANETLRDYGDAGVEVFFKFTCEECGERCTFREPNRIYDRGDCAKCGHQMEIRCYGFMIRALAE